MRAAARCAQACSVAMLLLSVPSEAQTDLRELRQVRWPLLDIVILPDSSAGVWLLVAPNPATVQWDAGTPVVSLAIDPVLALQWAAVARGLTGAEASGQMPNAVDRLTPRLRAKRGPQFVVLAKRRGKAASEEEFVFVVSDSRSPTQWKTFASSTQVDTLLSALESAARRVMSAPGDVTGASDAQDSVDSPVGIVALPEPEYPGELASKRRIGRVWMTYVVAANGRAEEGSFRPLLSDDPLFTRAAIQALLHAKYRPARLNQHPVRQRVFQVITFKMP